jgi:N-acyl-phosphatidylethanolamine-hydrolysing phospholipase D
LPIGAYEPRWFMSPVHMAPEETVRAHEILGAKTSIAIHRGTFQLTGDGFDIPQKQLKACRRDDSFLILRNGESAEMPC